VSWQAKGKKGPARGGEQEGQLILPIVSRTADQASRRAAGREKPRSARGKAAAKKAEARQGAGAKAERAEERRAGEKSARQAEEEADARGPSAQVGGKVARERRSQSRKRASSKSHGQALCGTPGAAAEQRRAK